MTRRRLILAALLAAAAVIWLSYGLVRPSQGVAVRNPPPRARVARAVLRDLPVQLYTLGTLEASKTAIIRPRVDGTILKVLFHEGDTVRQDAPLFEIDPTLYRTQADQAAAVLARDQATHERAATDLKRLAELAERALVPRQSLDQQRATVAELDATIRADQATLTAARAQLEWTTLRAPFTGRVGHCLVDAGNLVHAASDTALVDVVQLDPIRLIFNVPQEKLPQLRSRLSAGTLPISIESEGRWLTVKQHEPLLLYNTVDRATSSITLRALIDNRDARLWPGEALNVRITAEVRAGVVSVPEQAVFEAMSGPAVYIVDARNHLELRTVTVAGTADGWTGIAAGLATDERVLVADQERFAPGAEVVAEAPETASP
jgi:multidrug efflux system membrane fusion protein